MTNLTKRIHPKIPPIGELQVAPEFRPVFEAIATGDCKAIQAFPSPIPSRFQTDPLGALSIEELIALYAPWDLAQRYYERMSEAPTKLGSLLGRNWAGFEMPTALLSLFNSHTDTCGEVMARQEHAGLTLACGGVPLYPIYSTGDIVRNLWYGNELGTSRWDKWINEQTVATIQYLAGRMQQPQDIYSRCIGRFCGIQPKCSTWNKTEFHGDPRLIPHYQQISTAVCATMNAHWGPTYWLPTTTVEDWLRELAHAYIQYQSAHQAKLPSR